ncbi:putative RNA-directed DNA polymerase from transposon X-element [Trichonephila inaurata madagascariensis]|uniref:Putative RNA-directed DNA polymerase from transposon X-element n=1 Tax=Trichonephila inaurata madagascariensis TaxID=2747483 RepID=A0A8X6KH58_9ARAC|nr:putative RNA-directed DNA polymerase from transposon X-element [Trichonephila inaurata madagascariensis]
MNEHLPVCVALQETLLKPSCTSNIRGYSILRKDCNTVKELVVACSAHQPRDTLLPRPNSYIASSCCSADQLPSPFILLGDFNAHHLLWGCQDVNSRGKVVEKLLTELDLTLLNDGSNTYFHSPTQSFSAIDLSICSPSLLLDLTWSVLGNPLGSDHFPVVISYATPIACATLRQPQWKFDQADWETFRTQADITEDMTPRFPKPWWNEECQMAKKDQNKAWNRFRRYPTPDNMIAFNKARARARKIHRQRKRESWIKYVSNITCSTSSKEVWNKIRKLSGKYSASPVSMLVSNGVSVNTIPDIANTLAETFAKTSSCDNYTPAFQALKRREERVKLNFSSSNEEGYNSPLTLLELRAALHRSGNTAAGPDGLHYIIHRSSLTYSQPFHFRIRDLINDLNLNIGRIALCKISEVPPWKVIYPKVDFTLSCYSKACTPESTYRTLYLEHRELFSDFEPKFTDGSKSESHISSAVVSLSTVITDTLPISASIYTVELHALRIALEHISLSCGKKFIIYTDSLSALQSIVSLHSSSHPILVDITYALANHLKKKDIRFCWIPGHAGITGNELADTAARSATGSSERFPIPHSDLKACFRQKLLSVWQSNWDQQTENKLHSVMPVLAPTVPSSSNRREQGYGLGCA